MGVLTAFLDLSLIPTFDLPWQNIMVYEPCPSPVAASYLQAVCCNEGWSADRESLMRLYEKSYEGDEDSLQRSAPDLRRSMYQLQLWCSSPRHKDSMIDERSCGARACSPCLRSGDEKDDRRTLKNLRDHSEVVSFLDSEKCKFQSTREGRSASSDDEMGRMILYEEEEDNGGLLGSDRNAMITSTATRLARGRLDACITRGEGETGSFRTAELFRARVDKTLGKFIRAKDMALRRTEVYTEYRGYIVEMIKAEEEGEKEWKKGQEGGKGRRTRNSNRYERVFRVSVEERRQLGIE